jgi:alkylhydroperoxidase family enzyme
VRDVKVGAQTFADVRAFFSETQMAELTLLIGHYMMTARFLETLEVPLDNAATSWDKI